MTSTPRSRHAIDATVYYTAMIRETGHEPGEIVIDKAVRAPSATERKLLDMAPDAEVLEVERVRLAGRRRVIYSRDRIPQRLISALDDNQLNGSLYVALDWAGHAVARASAQLIPTVADPTLAQLLEISPVCHCCTSTRSTTTREAKR